MPTTKNGTTQNGLPMPDVSSHTCLDMKALETQDCKKMKDDSKIHHMLEDSMFKPRKRVRKLQYRHTLWMCVWFVCVFVMWKKMVHKCWCLLSISELPIKQGSYASWKSRNFTTFNSRPGKSWNFREIWKVVLEFSNWFYQPKSTPTWLALFSHFPSQ